MLSFLDRFSEMVRVLRSHPRVEVYSVVVEPPASIPAFQRAEKNLGMELPAALRAFYKAHNGVFLEWGIKGTAYAKKTALFAFPDYGQPPGCINLLPIEDSMSPHWEEESHVNELTAKEQAHLLGRAPNPQPPIRAVVIDNFSKYNHADLIVGPQPVVIVSTDHGADMDSSDFMSFETYLDVTLAMFGTCRYEAVGIGWSRKSQRIDVWDKRPTLDELIEKIEAGNDDNDDDEGNGHSVG